VTIRLTNENDNAPVVTAAQSLPLDGGVCNVVGSILGSDADDTNRPGFTTLQSWQIVGGDGASIFAIDPGTGAISVARPLSLDFNKTRYAVLVTVSDGLYVSVPEGVTITVPDKVDVYHEGHVINVSKNAGPAHLRHGDCLGEASIEARRRGARGVMASAVKTSRPRRACPRCGDPRTWRGATLPVDRPVGRPRPSGRKSVCPQLDSLSATSQAERAERVASRSRVTGRSGPALAMSVASGGDAAEVQRRPT
jgi:hypothetical protein